MQEERKELMDLVNPASLGDSYISVDGVKSQILDISFIRVVVQSNSKLEEALGQASKNIEFHLEPLQFTALAKIQSSREQRMRLNIEQILPSAKASLASFLSPKRIGESIVGDWNSGEFRHFHGLNESELWFNDHGGLLFSYLNSADLETQFIVRIKDHQSPLRVGTLSRKQYFEIKSWEEELPLTPLKEREVYRRLGECRDIITNIRPSGEMEYQHKQRLLKVISESLYSTGRAFERISPTPERTLSV